VDECKPLFTGAESKLMKNMIRSPSKVSQLERHMNLLVVSIGLFQTCCGRGVIESKHSTNADRPTNRLYEHSQ
jgi:hypothetical protein